MHELTLETYRKGNRVMYKYTYGEVEYECEFIQPLCRHLLETLTGDTVTVIGNEHLHNGVFLIEYAISAPGYPNCFKVTLGIDIHEKGREPLDEAVRCILRNVKQYLRWRQTHIIDKSVWTIEWE